MPMFTVPLSRAVQDEGEIASHALCISEVNPEHAIWLKEARDHEAPSVDGLKADVRGQLQHDWLLRVIVAADKYDGRCPSKAGLPMMLNPV